MSNVEFKQPIMLDVTQCHPREWNPNEMTPEKKQQLHDKIMDEGFTDPIKVCLVADDDLDPHWATHEDHYWIWAGHHRWQFCVDNSYQHIPAIIYDMTEEEQKFKTVQDNQVHGQLNDAKFTDLVNSLGEAPEVDYNDFGFDDDAEMARHLIVEKDKAEKKLVDDLESPANAEKPQAADIHKLVSEVVQQTASTVDQNYLWFTHNGQRICVILCEKDTKDLVARMIEVVTKDGTTLNDFMESALRDALSYS